MSSSVKIVTSLTRYLYPKSFWTNFVRSSIIHRPFHTSHISNTSNEKETSSPRKLNPALFEYLAQTPPSSLSNPPRSTGIRSNSLSSLSSSFSLPPSSRSRTGQGAGPNSAFAFPTDYASHNPRLHDPPPIPAQDSSPPRMGPNVGRSVIVRRDLATAIAALARITINNKVRTDSRVQRFHERAGMKRKRLKRERFRKRFKEGFKRMVSVVMEMKRQGL